MEFETAIITCSETQGSRLKDRLFCATSMGRTWPCEIQCGIRYRTERSPYYRPPSTTSTIYPSFMALTRRATMYQSPFLQYLKCPRNQPPECKVVAKIPAFLPNSAHPLCQPSKFIVFTRALIGRRRCFMASASSSFHCPHVALLIILLNIVVNPSSFASRVFSTRTSPNAEYIMRLRLHASWP